MISRTVSQRLKRSPRTSSPLTNRRARETENTRRTGTRVFEWHSHTPTSRNSKTQAFSNTTDEARWCDTGDSRQSRSGSNTLVTRRSRNTGKFTAIGSGDQRMRNGESPIAETFNSESVVDAREYREIARQDSREFIRGDNVPLLKT